MKIGNDSLIAASIGLLTGILAVATLLVREVQLTILMATAPVIPMILFPIGVALGKYLGERFFPFFRQLGKFASVGFLGVSIDFLVLNIVSKATAVTSGAALGPINIPGFMVALLIVYCLNKFWSFSGDGHFSTDARSESESGPVSATRRNAGLASIFKVFDKLHLFLAVVGIGLLINSAAIVAITEFIKVPTGISPIVWLNVAKVIACVISLIWNFFGYRNIVFRPSSKPLWPRSQS